MSDNVIKSTDINKSSDKPAKKAPAKKAAPKKQESSDKENIEPQGIKDDLVVIVFESGASYTSNGVRFTRENNIQEIPAAEAQLLLQLDNFRLANPFEKEDYLNSKEG